MADLGPEAQEAPYEPMDEMEAGHRQQQLGGDPGVLGGHVGPAYGSGAGSHFRCDGGSHGRRVESVSSQGVRRPCGRAGRGQNCRSDTDAPEAPSVTTSRKPSTRDDPTNISASETNGQTPQRCGAKSSGAAAAKRGQSEREKPHRPPAGKAGDREPKYRNPDDPSQKWSGRGRRPRWVTQALEAGRTLNDLKAGKR